MKPATIRLRIDAGAIRTAAKPAYGYRRSRGRLSIFKVKMFQCHVTPRLSLPASSVCPLRPRTTERGGHPDFSPHIDTHSSTMSFNLKIVTEGKEHGQ
jgi:hypothetical protein